MQAPIVIHNLAGDSMKTVNSVSDVIEYLGVKPSASEASRLISSINSAIADMMCGHLVACEIYDYRDGLTAIGLVTPHIDGAEYMKPLNSITLGIYPDSVKSFYRPPSEAAVRLTMALMEATNATKH